MTGRGTSRRRAPAKPATDWQVDDPECPGPPSPSKDDIALVKAQPGTRGYGPEFEDIPFSGWLFFWSVLATLVSLSAGAHHRDWFWICLVVTCVQLLPVLFCLVVRPIRRRAFATQWQQTQERVETWNHWRQDHRVSRTDLPADEVTAPARHLADDVMELNTALRATRAWADRWVGDEWHAVLDRQIWSVIDRLRWSVDTRRALVEANGRSTLDDAVATASAELIALDAEATTLSHRITAVVAVAREIDERLAARDAAEAEAHRDAQLRVRLVGADLTAADSDRFLRQLREQILTSEASSDLRVLTAQLEAVHHSLSRPADAGPDLAVRDAEPAH
jgi:hypothetical protein